MRWLNTPSQFTHSTCFVLEILPYACNLYFAVERIELIIFLGIRKLFSYTYCFPGFYKLHNILKYKRTTKVKSDQLHPPTGTQSWMLKKRSFTESRGVEARVFCKIFKDWIPFRKPQREKTRTVSLQSPPTWFDLTKQNRNDCKRCVYICS